MKFRTKAPHRLVALSSAAVIGIYSAGYLRTRAAAARFDAPSVRRPAPMVTPSAAPLTALVEPARAVDERARPVAPVPPGDRARTEATAPSTRPVAATASSSVTAAKPAETVAPAPAETVAPPSAPAPPPAEPSAPPEPAAPSAPPEPPAPALKDGTFTAWGYSRHGNIQVGVTIENGRIAAAPIWLCRTRYPCLWVEHLPGQVVKRQSPDVDYVSGATESANAYYDAVVEALRAAAK